ncbi:hypothetical protein RvY_01195 [Ramazzottius varieornatus]|uniref:Carbonic anhydrase n=1 Tax=Ramazzottius varieornatus TaxID=947166 RepID=A0A1D1UQT7_RAMVA|nr:hypothetical protein RvY_01195 [Ramazzottius varieornatus]
MDKSSLIFRYLFLLSPLFLSIVQGIEIHHAGRNAPAVTVSNNSRTSALLQNSAPQDVHWTYKGESEHELPVAQWASKYPKCDGRRQSPIMFDMKYAFKDTDLRRLTLVDYDDAPVKDQWSVTNNGHVVQFSGYFRTPPQLQGGNLPGKYIFEQMHFHWGSNATLGSEHLVDQKSFPLEVHLVHRRKNETMEEAVENAVGLAVIGVMFEVAKTREAPSRHMEDIVNAVRKVTQPGTTLNVTLPYFSLNELVPNANQSYFRYLGSLTTPPCHEAVLWTVMMEPLKVTESQMNVFRSVLRTSTGESGSRATARFLTDNFRPVQPLYDRNITYYTPPEDEEGILREAGINRINIQRVIKPNPENTRMATDTHGIAGPAAVAAGPTTRRRGRNSAENIHSKAAFKALILAAIAGLIICL